MSEQEAMRLFETGAIIISAGPTAAKRVRRGSGPGWSPQLTKLQVTAAHEAGHLVVAALLEGLPFEASVIPVSDTSGVVRSLGHVARKQPLPIDQRQFISDGIQVRKHIHTIAALTGETHLATLKRIRRTTAELIETHWSLINLIAAELLRRGTLDRDRMGGLILPYLRDRGIAV